MAQSDKPVGRPKKTLDDLPEGWKDKMLEIGMDGGSEIEMRVMLGIAEGLWYRLKKEEPEFSQAVKRSKDLCQLWWERHGRKMATGEKEGNPTVWIFNMKNRFKWTDRVEQDNLSSDGSFKPVQINLVGVTPDGTKSDSK